MLEQLASLGRRVLASRPAQVVRTLLLVASLALGCFLLGRAVHPFYAIEKWLFWRYCGYWAGALLLALSVLCGGMPIADRWGRQFRMSERWLLSAVVGLVVFFFGMFGLGMLRLLYWPVFFLWPAALLVLGGRRVLRRSLRLWRAVRWSQRSGRRPMPLTSVAAWAFGLASLLLLYTQIIHPLNTSYDARWYHLSLAEQYVAEHGIVRFPDGSYVNAYPQLASLIYAWAFLVPFATLFDKVELCAHLVFLLFLGILAGVGLLTRRLLRQRVRGAWSAVFLFPGLFLYDSGLHLGADHAAAFFAAPLALVAYVTYRAWRTEHWLLLGVLLAGATLTKYSVAAMFAYPLLALAVGGLVRLGRGGWRNPRELLLPVVCGLGLAFALSAAHWLKNWIYYGNPLYPYAAGLFHHPWGDYNRRIFETWSGSHEWSPRGTLSERLQETWHAVPRFAFEPHDWWPFHRNVPVFGFLFSLSGLALPFVRGATGRIWTCLVATYLGIFIWYWGMHQDRYLQLLLPWMAAATAAILVRAWRSSLWARLPVSALVALQVAWGSDVPFIPGHAMLGKPPTVAAIELAQTGYAGQTENRLRVFEPYESMARQLTPGKSRVLLHENHTSLGLGVLVVQDFAHTQGYVDYGSQPSLQAVHDMLARMGVTHVAWTNQSLGWAGWAGDLVFFDFVRSHTRNPRSFSGFTLAELSSGPDVDLRQAKVLFLACGNAYAKGLYRLSALNFPDMVVSNGKLFPRPETRLSSEHSASALLSEARYLLYDPGCGTALPHAVSSDFTHLGARSTVQLWARKGQQLHE